MYESIVNQFFVGVLLELYSSILVIVILLLKKLFTQLTILLSTALFLTYVEDVGESSCYMPLIRLLAED